MDWKEYYRERTVSAEEAVSHIKSGDWIFPSHAASEPEYLFDALLKRKDELKDVRIWQGLNIGNAKYARPEYAGHFIVSSVFLGENNREAVQNGRGEFTPMAFCLQPRAVREHVVPCDVYLGQVAPPDEDGYLNFGLSVDFARACAETAKLRIVQVNKNMPRTNGDTKIHVSQIDWFVEADTPLYELPLIDSSDPMVDRIGASIAELIDDGATLQMGQGKIPNAILKCLGDKKDLGIHTEVFSDNLLPLIKSGVINGARKSIHRGKIVSTFIQGTRALYDFVDGNDMVELYPVDYTNNVSVICRNDNMIAINSAIEVDLTGQVCADALGTKQFSGVGGQLDFIRGAAIAKGGKPIIALPATAKKGTVSRIVAQMKPGTPIATPRNDIFYVVTEYGVAELFGKSLDQRAKALINIAAPQFREQLEREFFEIYHEAGIWLL